MGHSKGGAHLVASLSTSVPAAVGSTKTEVSLVHLYLLRAGYLLLVVGLGSSVWPPLLNHEPWALTLSPFQGVGNSMLAAMPLLALLGLRYPLKMLPLLFFEMLWKAIWLVLVALPLWTAHRSIDADTQQTIQACLMVAIFPFLIPWRYVFTTLVLQPGDRWK
jgi:hypothetical protein